MGCRSCNSNPCGCRFSISPTRAVAASLVIQDTPSLDLTYVAGVLSGDVLISEDEGNVIEIREDGLFAEAGSGPSGGIIEVTTAELNALVAGDDLEIGATYAITDHSQGRVTAGTRVVVQAMSEDQITSNCQVLTEYDTNYWRGVYDLTTNKLFELEDNQGNICRQFPDLTFGPFTPVDDFDWGNPKISNCLVDNSTWTLDYGVDPEFYIDGVVLKNSSYLYMEGWTGNYIYNLVITGFSGVEIINSNAEFEECSFTNSGFLQDEGTGASFYFLVNCDHSFITCTAGTLYIEGVSLVGYSGIYHLGISGELIVHKAILSGEGEVRVVADATIVLAEVIISSVTGGDAGIGANTGVYISGESTDNITIIESAIDSSGVIHIDASDGIYIEKTRVSSNGVLEITGGNSVLGCEVNSGGTLTIGNNNQVERVNISANGVLTITSGSVVENVNITQGTLNNAGFDLTNVYILGAGSSTATGINSGTARDYFNDTIV